MLINDLASDEIKILTPLWLVKRKTHPHKLKFACKARWKPNGAQAESEYITFIHFSKATPDKLDITRSALDSKPAYDFVDDIKILPDATNEELRKYLK